MNELNKNWKQTSENAHIFLLNNKEVAYVDLSDKKNIIIKFNNKQLIIKRKNKYSRLLKVFDDNNILVAQTSSRKWYSNDVILQYEGQTYIMKSRNNPLFEMVLQDLQKQDIISYGVQINDLNQSIKIVDHRQVSKVLSYLPDIILWLFFISTPRMDILEDLL